MARETRSAGKSRDSIQTVGRLAAKSGVRPKQIVKSICPLLVDYCSRRILRPLNEQAQYELVGTLDDDSLIESDQGAAEWLTAEQAARLLGVPAQYLYRHWRRLPFSRKFSPKCLRFSKRGILESKSREVT